MSITKKKAGKVSILKDVLVFDEVPTAGSTNLVESGSVKKAIDDSAFEDAPKDGKVYARKDGEWIEITITPPAEE